MYVAILCFLFSPFLPQLFRMIPNASFAAKLQKRIVDSETSPDFSVGMKVMTQNQSDITDTEWHLMTAGH